MRSACFKSEPQRVTLKTEHLCAPFYRVENFLLHDMIQVPENGQTP